jgi:CheY-like chemotaxis protein/curved DNA-binding protein CbpA
MGLVLIIEDDESVAKAIAEVCVGLGLETATAKTGPLALQAFAQQPPSLVTLDMLLPGGMDGTRVADEIRKLMGGESVPIVVITGVMKNPSAQRELQARAGVRSFVMKPFKADELRAAIARPLGIALQAEQVSQARSGMDSFEGDLGMMSALQLFADLHRNKAEGVLELTRGQARKRFFLQRGFFRYATSNVKAETLTGLLQAKGVPEGRLNDALAVMKASALSLPDALVQVGLVTTKDLPALLSQQTEEVAITSATWPDGHISFKANPLPPGLEGRANPLHCIFKAVKRLETPEQARAAIQALGKAPLDRTPELEREGFAIRGIFPGEAVTPMLNGKTTAAEVLQRAKPQDLLLVHALMTAGLVKARGAPVAAGSAPAPAAAAPRGPRRQYTEEEEANRTLIAAEARRQQGCQTHYQVLGVDPRADLATVKASYLRMAKRFHTDVYAGQELGDLAQVLQDAFKRISEAGAALGDDSKRKDYDTFLDRKARGLPTDVNEMMRAEGAYNRAESLRQNGRLRDAEKLYREAVSIDAGQVTYLLGLAQAVYKLQGKPGHREATELLDKAAKLGEESPSALMLRAQLLLDSGDPKAAMDVIRKVTTTKPGFEGAMELLKQAKAASQAPAAAADKGGLFGKLFGSPDKKK